MTVSVDQTERAAESRHALGAGWRRLIQRGPPVLHPFLMAAFPIVFLFARNLHQAIAPSDMVGPLELSIGATAACMAVGWAIFRNARAVGVVLSAWLLLFFSYGRVSEALHGESLGRDLYLLIAWGALAVAAVVIAFLLRSRLRATTGALNLIAGVLVAMNLVPIALYRPPVPGKTGSSKEWFAPQLAAAKASTQAHPDIYYIMLEDYGEARTLKELYGIDTQPFNRWLREQGFYVATNSLSNYQRTSLSMSSSVNLQYLSTFLGAAANDESEDAIRRALHGFVAARFLQALGYRYVHMGMWWAPTAADPTADVEVKLGGLSEFSSILYDTTILPALSTRVNSVGGVQLDIRHRRYENAIHELRNLLQASKLRGPKFVFAHLSLPHARYVFDRDGRFLTKAQAAAKTKEERFADQVLWTSRKMQQVLGQLLEATDRKAVIILQTDEGAEPVEYPGIANPGPDLRNQLLHKYGILNAYYLPHVSHAKLYPSITPVNSFRLVFDLYFHAGFGLLPDRIWARDKGAPTFVDITDLVGKR
jgi:hypothetical protein